MPTGSHLSPRSLAQGGGKEGGEWNVAPLPAAATAATATPGAPPAAAATLTPVKAEEEEDERECTCLASCPSDPIQMGLPATHSIATIHTHTHAATGVICLDGFTPDNPEMRTLCSCGENRARFHYPCLIEYIQRSSRRRRGPPVCPTCRGPLYFEELD